ncbi:MAG: glycosyltransferase [Candidatus Eisenbacteria sp.]|nr:glycosyltransferase [Candidatus Eisenbacteria bacterium]
MDRIGILFLTNWLPVGGFETHLLSIVRKLDKESFHPVLCCLKDGGPLEEEFRATGIPVYTRLQRHRLDPMGLVRLVRIMKRERIHLLDTDVMRNTILLGTLAARVAGVRAAVVSVHLVVRVERPGIIEWPARMVMGRIDRVIALFEDHRKQLVDEERVDPEKVIVLPNGVDTEQFSPRAPRADLREELGIPGDSPVAAIVASLLPLKRHALFFEAAAKVLEMQRNAHFLVIGEGPEREHLETQVREMGLDSAVHFLGRRRDMPDLLTIIDVNVLSSHWEAAPISALEAMACGIPTVSTRVGAMPEMVVDGETGFLVDVGDGTELAQAIARLMGNPALRKKTGEASRRRAEETYSMDKVTRRRENVYRELVKQKTES